MAVTKYYGILGPYSYSGITQKDWTTLPTMYLYWGARNGYSRALGYFTGTFSSDYRDEDYMFTSKYGYGYNTFKKYLSSSYNEMFSFAEKAQGMSSSYQELNWYKVTSQPDAKYGFPSITKQMTVGMTLYGSWWTSEPPVKGTVCEYYKINITLAFAGQSTGTISLYNGSTLLTSGAGTYTYVGTSIPTFTIRYSTASQDSTWHDAYFFNGLRLDGAVQAVTYGYGTASFSFTPTSNSHTCSVNVGERKTITFVGRTGVASYSASFTRTYETGNFTKTSSGTELAPTSVSGSTGTTYLRFESGNIPVSATAVTGSVFTTTGGFCSDVAALNCHGDGSSSISGTFVTPTSGGTVNIVPTSYVIKIAMPSGYESWGSVKITDSAGNEGTELSLVPNRVYTFSFSSAREDYEQPTINVWKKNGVSLGTGISQWTAPSAIDGEAIIEPTLDQNAWPVTVTGGANGMAAWSKRYNISPLTELANTGYLRKAKTDYGIISVTPSAQYAIASRTLTGVEAYTPGGEQAFRLVRDSSHTVHNISYTFALAECAVNVVLPTDFSDKVEVGIGTSSATTAMLYFYGYDTATAWTTGTTYQVGTWVNVTSGGETTAYRCAVAHVAGTFEDDLADGKWTPMYVTVMCRIKQDYYDQYRVADWEIGGVSGMAGETMVAGRSYYYIVTPSNVAGRMTLVCKPRVVSTTNPLTVTKMNIDSSWTGDYNNFSDVKIRVGGSTQAWESITSSVWTRNISENTEVCITAYPTWGGKIGTIAHTGFTPLEEDANMIRFNMPGSEATVSIKIGELGKVTLVLDLSNLTSASNVVGKITLSANSSSFMPVEVLPSSVRPVSLNVYRETNYTLTATDTDEVYGFVDWYKNGSVDPTPTGGTELVRNINLTDSSTTYVAAYAIRQTYDCTHYYGIRSGDNVAPVSPLPSGVYGCIITTARDGSGGWVLNRTVDFKVGDWPSDTGIGTTSEDGIVYKWTPERVQVKSESNAYETVWTYDSTRPSALTGSFRIRGAMDVRMIYIKERITGYAMARALLMGGVLSSMGQLGIYSVGMVGYAAVSGTASAACETTKKCVFMASPMPGYAFAGWYTLSGSTYTQVVTATGIKVNGAVLEVSSLASTGATYYASFVATTSHVKVWNDGATAKTFEWQSKVYVGSQFFAMRCVRVYSDTYPVSLTLMTATSPNDCLNTTASRKLTISIPSQRPILIPTMRLEKYFAFKVSGTDRINHVGIGTSMEALK